MSSLKKLLYGFFIFFVVLILTIVFAANSSFVIKKAADHFAPDYKISYDDITGNVFTGVKISGLKFDNQTLTPNIKFSWNPSKILYKRVAINEISVEALDVDVVKALIASFPSSEDSNSSSEPFPLVVLVDKVNVSVNPFAEQGILISKTLLNVEDVKYASDEIDIDHLMLQVDTNVTNVLLEASLDDGKLEINKLFVEDVDTVSLETMFLAKEANSSNEETSETAKSDTEEPLNPLIPKEVELKHFLTSIKPRLYKSANIEEVKVEINDLNADIEKILSNTINSIVVGNFDLLVDSNVSHIDISGNLKDETLTFDTINLKEIHTIALQHLFAPETNASAVENMDENAIVIADDKKAEKSQEVNHLIPKYVVLKSLTTQIVPALYDPVNIMDLLLRVTDVKFNIQKLMVESGYVDLNGTTNLSNITYSGKIKDNQILGPIVLSPNEELFTLYELPVRREAIGDITIDIDASKEHVVVDLKAKAEQILVVEKAEDNGTDENASKAFNLDIDSLLSHVVYTIADNTMVADTKIMITTPYAENISVTNKFLMDKNMSYSGEIKAEKLIGIDAKFVKPLNNFNVKYSGDLTSVKTDISSDGLKGTFVSSDFKKGDFHLETTQSIVVRDMVELPAELNGTKVNAIVDVPLDFAAITPLKAKVKILSNVTNLDTDIMYGDALQVKMTSTMPEDSLLKLFDENVKWNAINPLVINAQLNEKDVDLKVKSKELSTDVKYFLDDGKVDGKIMLGGLVTTVKGVAQEKVTINTNVNSMKSLLNSVQSFYTLEVLPPVEGALNLSVDVTEMKQIDLMLSSPQINYQADRKTEHIVNDMKVVLSADPTQLVLKSYQVTYNKMEFFATKPSTVSLKDTTVTIAPLWLNDELKVEGEYNLKTRKGKVDAQADKLHFSHEMIDLDSKIDIKTVLDTNKTSVKGKVVLLGGNIKYDMAQKTFASDSDILIVQEMKEEEASPFMDTLTVLIHVETKDPLVYKQGPIDVQSEVNIDIHKAEHSEFMVLGSIDLMDGSSYVFEGKKFVLEKSHVYMTGDPNKPLLDINVKYQALNHLVTILVTGTPSAPNISFSSVPSLSKDQILALILFDSEAGAGSNSGDDMMKMMGGAMAKSALSNMGIKLDHLVLGEGNSIEVGKKLTNDITIIYVNDEVSEVKLKYEHSPRLESVFGMSEESQSYDIVYKRDFAEEDIVFSK